MSGARVAVVGAGLTGLAAARHLVRAGVECTVFDAHPRPGGRRAALEVAGVRVEEPAALPASAPEVGAWVAELGLRKPLLRQPLLRVGGPGGALRRLRTRSFLGAGPLRPLRTARLRALARWLGAELAPCAPERNTRLDDRSLADFARLYLGRRAYDELCGPLVSTLFGVDARATSRQLWFGLLDAVGEPALALADGLGSLCDALAAPLVFRGGERVTRVRAAGRGLELASGESVHADAVLLCVAPERALPLLPEPRLAEQQVLRERRRGDLVQLVLLDPPLEPGPRAAWLPARAAGPLAGTLRGSGPDAPLWLRARPSVAARAPSPSDAELIGALLADASSLHPELRGSRPRARLLHQRGVVARFPPGSYRALARLRALPPSPHPIVYTSTDHIGPHPEAALTAAQRAADELLTRLTQS